MPICIGIFVLCTAPSEDSKSMVNSTMVPGITSSAAITSNLSVVFIE